MTYLILWFKFLALLISELTVESFMLESESLPLSLCLEFYDFDL